MVQSVGSLGNLYPIGAVGASSRSGAAQSADAPASTQASGQSLASALDLSSPQGASSDFASPFQQMSSTLQSLMVQVQAAGKADASDASAGHAAHGGNRALQGDANALIYDLHGMIQVEDGDLSSADGVTPAASPATSSNATTASTTGVASPAPSSDTASASSTPAAGEWSSVTYSFAQDVMQALQNYTAANANGASSRPDNAVSAVG